MAPVVAFELLMALFTPPTATHASLFERGAFLMRHYIAYHNTEGMGAALTDGDPCLVFSNRSVERLVNHTVWFIVGNGVTNKQYTLGSVFKVDQTGETRETGYKWFASGSGHVFDPPVPVNRLPWFAELFRVTAHFSLGVQEIQDEAIIAGLVQLARQAGYTDFD